MYNVGYTAYNNIKQYEDTNKNKPDSKGLLSRGSTNKIKKDTKEISPRVRVEAYVSAIRKKIEDIKNS